MMRTILRATVIAGTLDIAWAAANTVVAGGDPLAMLRGVASGPLPNARTWGLPGALAGLLVHFAIMAVIASVFVVSFRRVAVVRSHPLFAGAVYGVAVWLVMYALVLPARFGAPFPSPEPAETAKQLFAHIVLVGLVIGFVVSRSEPRGTEGLSRT